MSISKFCLPERMKNALEHVYHHEILFILIIALGAAAVRGYIVYKTPELNNSVDLRMYMNMGRLVAHGINPYDFSDNVELRRTFRNEGMEYNAWVSQTQEWWDYGAASNLPLTGLYLGLIDKIRPNGAWAFRLTFMFVDVLLSVMIGLFIREFWKTETSVHVSWFFVLGLGALNPILLRWGIYMPEVKNLQILLMLSALYCALKSRLFLSSALLGCSVAFMALGVFIGPILLLVWLEKTKGCPHRYWRIFLLGAVSLIFCFIWFIPYYPEVLTMVNWRYSGGVSVAGHASLWTLIYPLIGDNWKTVRVFMIGLVVSLSFMAAIKDKFKPQIFFLGLLYGFTVLWLSAGSLDRYNMAVLYIVLSMGLMPSINHKLLATAYLLLYVLVVGLMLVLVGRNNELFYEKDDALFLFIFTMVYVAVLLRFCSAPTAAPQKKQP